MAPKTSRPLGKRRSATKKTIAGQPSLVWRLLVERKVGGGGVYYAASFFRRHLAASIQLDLGSAPAPGAAVRRPAGRLRRSRPHQTVTQFRALRFYIYVFGFALCSVPFLLSNRSVPA